MTQSPPAAMPVPNRRRKILLIALLVGLPLLAVIGFQVAASLLKSQIEQALGPRGEVREISVGLGSVEILGLRLPAEEKSGWPAEDLLRAERVVVVPSLGDLLGARVVLRSVRIEGFYLSMLRTRDEKLVVLPGLTKPAEAKAAKGKEKGNGKAAGEATSKTESGPEISIGRIELADGAVEYFDASIQRPALKIRMEQIDITVDDIHLPNLLGKSQLKVGGIIKGPHQDGRVDIAGDVEIGSKESDVRTQLRGVDLLALKPYLIRATETGIKRGSMDLDLHSVVSKGRLHAPGTLALHNLELSGGSFMGVPQSAVVAMMKSKSGTISIDFSLDGDINDPQFSLNEQLLGQVGNALANLLGISLEGLARGVGGAGGSVARGLGEGLGKLFGK